MNDKVCPIGDCTATVQFENDVVDMTARYRLHDLDAVDEFAVCPSCDAEVAGFYDEEESGGDGEDIELILDIDDTDGDEGGEDGDDPDGSDVAAAGDGFDAPGADFDDPDEVLDDADLGASAGDDESAGDEDAFESVFGSSDDE